MKSGMRGRMRSVVCAAGAALTLAAAACEGPTEPRTPDGAYRLGTVNGRAVPAPVYSDDAYEVVALEGRVELQAGGRYSSVYVVRETIASNVSTYVDSVGGTWREETPGVVAIVVGRDTTRATWQSRQLTFQRDDGTGRTLTFVYDRR